MNPVSLGISAAGCASLPRNAGVWRRDRAAVSQMTVTEMACVLCTHLAEAEKDYSKQQNSILQLGYNLPLLLQKLGWRLKWRKSSKEGLKDPRPFRLRECHKVKWEGIFRFDNQQTRLEFCTKTSRIALGSCIVIVAKHGLSKEHQEKQAIAELNDKGRIVHRSIGSIWHFLT